MVHGANLFTVFVVLFAAWGLVMAVLLLGQLARAYEEIGGGVFDRPQGDRGDRPPPDAEYDEWLDALARSTRPQEPPPRAGRTPPRSPGGD